MGFQHDYTVYSNLWSNQDKFFTISVRQTNILFYDFLLRKRISDFCHVTYKSLVYTLFNAVQQYIIVISCYTKLYKISELVGKTVSTHLAVIIPHEYVIYYNHFTIHRYCLANLVRVEVTTILITLYDVVINYVTGTKELNKTKDNIYADFFTVGFNNNQDRVHLVVKINHNLD